MAEIPSYPVGLRLDGKHVVVVGGGAVAQRRIPALLAAGAQITVISPEVTPAVEGLVPEVVWEQRAYSGGDLSGAWYAVACTADADVNEAVVREADAQRTFCSRVDDAREASAWTAASARVEGLTVSVQANREPRRAAAVRDAIVDAMSNGLIGLKGPETSVAGVTLVSGGPGDPELITVAGRRALAAADVVVADRLAPRELLAELSSDVELIDVAKLPRGRAATQESINEVLIARAKQGLRVVRFKGGDSFVFGRGYEELLACAEAGVDVRVIPGVSSSLSVPALAGIPVTHRGVTHEFTVISGHLPPGHLDSLTNWDAVAQMTGTVVLMMAVQNTPLIAQALIERGRDPKTPLAAISEGSMAQETTVITTLEDAATNFDSLDVRAPAIIVIGEVVAVGHG